MKTFFVFLALTVAFVAAVDNGACSLCNMVEELLDTQSLAYKTQEEWTNHLLSIADKVCANVPETIASPAECKSYIELNAPYMVEIILSPMNDDEERESICRIIGVCVEPVDSKEYKLVYPTINENRISYLVEEKEITKDTEFNYKLFLGHPKMLNNDSYELEIELHSVIGCEVHMKVTNKTTFVEATSCNEEKNCTMQISEPGKGLWYYITVRTTLTAESASFALNATERNEIIPEFFYATSRHGFNGERFTLILCMTFSLLCTLCLCISRCMFTKRPVRFNQQQYAHMVMQPIPETAIPMENVFGSEQFDPDTTPFIAVMYAPYPSQV
jgi:hypothetical protein